MLPDPNFSLDLDLSLEQEFKMRIFEESLETMNLEDMRSLLIEASKLLMVKDNVIRGLMRKSL
ncbi:phycobilisome degradation protein NblA [Chondrocystis sp. NIES-4102]|nr:phycobilisome degradation protein NblA [Chondrocystis sp. NIES-4102]